MSRKLNCSFKVLCCFGLFVLCCRAVVLAAGPSCVGYNFTASGDPSKTIPTTYNTKNWDYWCPTSITFDCSPDNGYQNPTVCTVYIRSELSATFKSYPSQGTNGSIIITPVTFLPAGACGSLGNAYDIDTRFSVGRQVNWSVNKTASFDGGDPDSSDQYFSVSGSTT